MKPKTKNIILGVSLGLNAIFALILGGALIKGCNAPKTQENAPSSVSPRTLREIPTLANNAPQKALDGFTDENDLMQDATRFNNTRFSASSGNVYIQAGAGYRTWAVALPAGVYAVTLRSPDAIGQYFVPVPSEASEVYESFRLCSIGSLQTDTFPQSSYQLYFKWLGVDTYGDVFYLNIPDDTYFFSYEPIDNAKPSLRVVLVSALKVGASDIISFPSDYNPITPFGYSSDGLIGQLAGSKTSPFRLDLHFRTSGLVFKRIDYYFIDARGLSYLSTAGTSTSPVTFTASGYVYPSLINFIDLNDNVVPAWRAMFGVDASGNTYMRNLGEWISTSYQTIEVLSYSATTGLSGLAPSLNQVELLALRTSAKTATPVLGEGGYDVFSLLSTGFSSVGNILSIAILPNLTLGTLIFIPLVVTIILVIVRLLQK